MSQYKVDTDKARPAHSIRMPGVGRAAKYPFDSLTKKDYSFFVPFGDDDPKVVKHRLHSAATQAGKKMNCSFSLFTVQEHATIKVHGKTEKVLLAGVRIFRN